MRTVCWTTALAAVGLLPLLTSSAQAQYPNPVVGATGRYVTGQTYDPWNNNVTVHTNQDVYRQSYFDPARNYADPGSRQYVDRWVQDQSGNWVREHGWTWTTNGVPHGDLTRSSQPQQVIPSTPYPGGTVTPYWPQPGVSVQGSTSVHYGYNPGLSHQGSTGMHYSMRPGMSHQGSTSMHYAPGPGVSQQNNTSMHYGLPRGGGKQ